MGNFFESNEINIHEILDSIDVGIWILEYNEEKNIYRFYGNETLARIMGLSREQKEQMSPEQWYKYWYERIDLNYLDSIKRTIDNIIFIFDYKIAEHITDEVCYIWNHDLKGKVNVRCGGKVVSKQDGVYKICGYHQDYTNILRTRDCIKNKNELLSTRRLENINYLKYYKELAYVDELTGIVNRRGFFDKINNIMENRMRRSSDNLWLTILDLDFFKKINDNFGHLSGDEVLKFMGNMLKDLERQHDRTHVFRYGGEEFIILMYQYSFEEVRQILENLRQTIENSQIPVDMKHIVKITCSMGTAYLKKVKNMEIKDIIYEGIQKADTALYKAKNSGRNRIEFKI